MEVTTYLTVIIVIVAMIPRIVVFAIIAPIVHHVLTAKTVLIAPIVHHVLTVKTVKTVKIVTDAMI